MYSLFEPSHRGGAGSPLVLLHGFTGTWRTWELVLPALERHHEVFAPTLPGHAGGPPFDASGGMAGALDAVERLLDEAGIDTAHIAGNSLGGFVALHLAARGRARSVVALAPAGGWGAGSSAMREVLGFQANLHAAVQAAAPHADALVASPQGRRNATQMVTVNYDHIPADLLAHQIRGLAAADAPAMLRLAAEEGYDLDAERIDCPVRIVWGMQDKLLALPDAGTRFRRDWLPTADWIELDDVGHAPQLDVPLVTAQLILEFTGAA